MQAAGVGAGLELYWARRLGFPRRRPARSCSLRTGTSRVITFLGYNDMRLPVSPVLRGWDQTYEFRVIDTRKGRFAYCGNGAMGWSIVDVSDPRHMRVVWRQPHVPTAASPMAGQFLTDNTQYIDIKGDHILVVKRNRAFETWDVSDPAKPVRLAIYSPQDIHPTMNAPFHGLWVHEEHGRRYAFSAFRPDGFIAEILDICDITNPNALIGVGRCGIPE